MSTLVAVVKNQDGHGIDVVIEGDDGIWVGVTDEMYPSVLLTPDQCRALARVLTRYARAYECRESGQSKRVER